MLSHILVNMSTILAHGSEISNLEPWESLYIFGTSHYQDIICCAQK